MHYLLIYDLASDYLERRGEFRKEHIDLAWKAVEDGHIVVAGALDAPVDTAILMFQGDSPAAAEAFARSGVSVPKCSRANWVNAASPPGSWTATENTPCIAVVPANSSRHIRKIA